MRYMPLIAKDVPYRVHVGRDQKKRLHWHGEMELLLCLSGMDQVLVEGKEYILHTGDALVLPGYVAHTGFAASDDCLRVAINVGFDLLGKGYYAIRHVQTFLGADQSLPEEVRQPLNSLFETFRTDKRVTEENEWLIRANLLLLCRYLRLIASRQHFAEAPIDRIRKLDHFDKALEYVKLHYREKISVEQMAELSGYAKTYFCRQFKNTIGMPFYRYLTCYRIAVACMLLEEESMSIAQVAEESGFSTQALFCRTFKEITEMTPTQFQALSPEDKNMNWM